MGIREANALRVLQNGNTVADRTKNSLITSTNKDFESNPSYREVIRNTTENVGAIIADNSSNSASKVDNIRSIIMKPEDVLNVGDIFDFNNNKWICTSAEMFSDIYYRGMITQCNNILSFYKTHILFEVPCIFSDISIDLQEGKFMNLPIGHYLVYIPSGYISKSDMNLRFILNDSAYKIEGISNAVNGLVKVELTDDEITADDNLELGIANWHSNQISENPILEEIVITPMDTTLTVAKKTTFNARFFDNGIENLLIHFDWVLTNVDGSSNTYVNISPNNRTCDITPVNSYSAIGKIVNLKVSLTENPTRFVNKQYKIVSLV
jgi:hypothetical protein